MPLPWCASQSTTSTLAPVDERRRGDRDVVQQAEAHRVRGHRVVAGRAHREERAVGRAGVEGLDRREPGAGRADRGLERALAHRGVGVERAATARAHPLQRVEVRGRMHPLELGARRRSAPQIGAIARRHRDPPGRDRRGRHRAGPGARMAASRIVLGEQRIGRDEHHDAEGTGPLACERDPVHRPTVRSLSGDDVDLTHAIAAVALAFGVTAHAP